MSYPSQPSYTPPYGQPQPPNRSNNLWLGGAAIIVVLIIIMTVTLLIVQRSGDDSATSGDGGTTEEPPATTEEEPTDEGPTTEETTGPPDDGGDDNGSEPAGFSEATCNAFDLSLFEELYDEDVDPDQTHTSASSSSNTGSLSCNFYTEDYDSSSVAVSAVGGAEYAVEWLEGDREFWDAEDGYEVTDFTAVGDDGFHTVYGGEGYQKRAITIIVGALHINVNTWIYPDEQDPDEADEYLQDLCEQAAAMFADYM